MDDTPSSPSDPVGGLPVPLIPLKSEVDAVIRQSVIAVMAASTVPVPLLDLAAVTGLQVSMIHRLASLYGRPFSNDAGRTIVTALTGGLMGVGAGRLAASAVKGVPGIGWIVGIAALPAMNGASTYAVGRVIDRHLREGGSLLEISAETLRAGYREAYRRGKAFVLRLKGDDVV